MYLTLSTRPNPNPAAAPSTAPKRRLGTVLHIKYTTKIIAEAFNISSINGAKKTKIASPPTEGPIAVSMSHANPKPTLPAKIKDTHNPRLREFPAGSCDGPSKAARRALIPGKKFVEGP
jgi:hypothetical protein